LRKLKLIGGGDCLYGLISTWKKMKHEVIGLPKYNFYYLPYWFGLFASFTTTTLNSHMLSNILLSKCQPARYAQQNYATLYEQKNRHVGPIHYWTPPSWMRTVNVPKNV